MKLDPELLRLVRRAANALYGEFQRELDEIAKPTRVCRGCFKPGEDSPMFYAFEDTGACTRCGGQTEPRNAVALHTL